MKLVTIVLYRRGAGVAWSGMVPLATKPEDRIRGLSSFTNLPSGTGMLFRVHPGEAFTMQPMTIPLDMIWLRGNQVARIDRNLQPGSPDPIFAPPGATMLLEIGAGQSERVCEGCVFHTVSR